MFLKNIKNAWETGKLGPKKRRFVQPNWLLDDYPLGPPLLASLLVSCSSLVQHVQVIMHTKMSGSHSCSSPHM